MASWMRVFVDKCAVTDVSKDRIASFSRVKTERNRRMKVKYKMGVVIISGNSH